MRNDETYDCKLALWHFISGVGTDALMLGFSHTRSVIRQPVTVFCVLLSAKIASTSMMMPSYMQPIITDVLDLCVKHTDEPWRNGWIDWDLV